ncbi:TetR/AcrR family transcriptional regulator [Hyalangium sp.]|uniref:TetR/AcrR family transcriptional regulator n=1 Tax=Hyalangium sp. TaxID=2028555 RepID=UPI002D3FFFAB|nr:TetR/AcrR family transcriptional regulator [Hyalangium sp.]HYI02534.1 TetR/AcrR family transcriptional regulator [Hyalangium sp.]
MGIRDEQKERTRQDILDSAIRLLRGRGISGASVSEVMKGAGLTVGGFYAHFDSKEALVGVCLRQALRERWSQLLTVVQSSGSEALEVLLRRYLSRRHRDNPAEGCPLPAVVGEAAHAYASPQARDALAEELGAWAEGLGTLPGGKGLRRQQALGVIALLFGGLSLARALKGTSLSDEILEACRALGRAAMRGP